MAERIKSRAEGRGPALFALLFAFACTAPVHHAAPVYHAAPVHHANTSSAPGGAAQQASPPPSPADEPSPDPAPPSRMSEAERRRQNAAAASIVPLLSEIQSCYETLLAANPNLNGNLRLFFTLDDVGVASKVRATQTLRASPAMAECIVDIIRPVRFRSGIAGDYEFPFVFAPQN